MNHLNSLALLAANDGPNLSSDKVRQSALGLIGIAICIGLAYVSLKAIWRDTDEGDYSLVAKKVITSLLAMIPVALAGAYGLALGWGTAILEFVTSLVAK